MPSFKKWNKTWRRALALKDFEILTTCKHNEFQLVLVGLTSGIYVRQDRGIHCSGVRYDLASEARLGVKLRRHQRGTHSQNETRPHAVDGGAPQLGALPDSFKQVPPVVPSSRLAAAQMRRQFFRSPDFSLGSYADRSSAVLRSAERAATVR